MTTFEMCQMILLCGGWVLILVVIIRREKWVFSPMAPVECFSLVIIPKFIVCAAALFFAFLYFNIVVLPIINLIFSSAAREL